MKEKLFFHEFYTDITGNKNIMFSNNNKFIKMTELSFKKNLFSYDSKTFFTKVEDIINDFLSKDGVVNTEDYIYEFNNEKNNFSCSLLLSALFSLQCFCIKSHCRRCKSRYWCKPQRGTDRNCLRAFWHTARWGYRA